MASELSTQVYTAPQAPNYLGDYAQLLKSIPNAGLQFLAAQQAAAQNQKAQAEYTILNQKAKQFMDLYPAFKAAQIAKLNAETSTIPYRQDLLASQAAYQRAHANAFLPPPEGTASPFAGITPGARPGTAVGPATAPNVFVPRGVLAADANPEVVAPPALVVPEGPLPPPRVDPFAVRPLDEE